MDDVTDALLGLKDCDSVINVAEENRRDGIEHVSPLLDAVSKHMASEVNTDITGKKKRKRIKKEVNVVNEIQSIHQMEMNAGSTREVTAPANGILEASDSVTKAVLNLEKAEQPRLDDVPKENGSEVNKSMTKKKKPKKKVNDRDGIPSLHQIEMNGNSTEDLVEVKAQANGEQPKLDVVRKEYGSEGILDTTKKQKRKKKVAVDSEIQCMQEMEKNMSNTENHVEVKTRLSDNVGAYSNTSDILPLKDVRQQEIAEQPRLDVVPKEYGSEGNLDTTKKKKRKKKVAVVSEIQCTQEMEKNMSSTENLVEVKTHLSDSVGANAVASNEPEKDLPNKDVPKKDLPNKDVAEKDLPNKDVPVKLSELELDVVSKDKASECRDLTKKKKETAINEIQWLDEVVKNMGCTENHKEIKARISDNLVVSEIASDMDTTKKKKRKKKVTVTDEGQCMEQTVMVMESTGNLVEIKSQVNGNLGATDNASDCHVVNNESEKNIPSKDILMEELSEQPKLDVSKEIVSDTDTTKKKKRKKKVTITTETQCMDQTGKNMTSTKNHMEIKARTSDDLGASDNIGDYHVVVNLSDNDIPLQELSDEPKLEVLKEKTSTRGTDMTKKKRKKKVKAVENHAIEDMNQIEVNANISENHMEINGYDNMSDYHVINKESKKNLLDKDVSTLEPVKHPESDVGLVVDASEEAMGAKKKKKLKEVNDLNDVQNMDQTLLNVVTTENVTAIIDQNNGTSEALHGVRDFYAVNEELEHNLVDKVLTSLPVTKHSNLALTSTENPSENGDVKKKKKRISKKANLMNDVPIMEQGIAVMKDVMDHTLVNSESERDLIDGTVRSLPEHTKFDAVSTESALEGNTETKKRKRKSAETKKRKTTETKKSTETKTRKSTETSKRKRSKHKEVKDINEVQSFTQKETERSVARRKNKLREMNPSDAMYKILFSDEEPVDAMFKILLPEPATCLVHSVPCERQSTNPIRRKLIVLDVNGLLADVVMPAPKDCRGDVHILRRAIFKRPFVDDFLNFCFQNFDVAIWSSRSKVIVDRIVDYLLGSLKNKLLFCWNMSHATQTGSKTLDNIHKPLVCKELRKIWEDFEGYDKSNTLLLDDSPYKALLNPLHTAIFPSSFHYMDKKDNSLGPGGDLRVYLERLLSSDNVQSYVEQNPFGQAAINEMDPSWEFYSSVLQTVTSQSVTKT